LKTNHPKYLHSVFCSYINTFGVVMQLCYKYDKYNCGFGGQNENWGYNDV